MRMKGIVEEVSIGKIKTKFGEKDLTKVKLKNSDVYLTKFERLDGIKIGYQILAEVEEKNGYHNIKDYTLLEKVEAKEIKKKMDTNTAISRMSILKSAVELAKTYNRAVTTKELISICEDLEKWLFKGEEE